MSRFILKSISRSFKELRIIDKKDSYSARYDQPSLKSLKTTKLVPSSPFQIELLDYLIKRPDGLGVREAMWFFIQIVEIVHQLHKRKITYNNIKLEKVIIDTRTHCCYMEDFAASTKHDEESNICSLYYASPEKLSAGFAYNPFEAEIWSLGVCLFALVTGYFPFDGETPSEVLEAAIKNQWSFPGAAPIELVLFVADMLNLVAFDRPSTHKIREHSFFVHWRKILFDKSHNK